jgi:hypothetical protein
MPIHLTQEAALTAALKAREDLVRVARAVPEERRFWCPAAIARHTVEILAHCAASNTFLAAVIGEHALPYRTQEEEDAAIEACTNLDLAEMFLNRSVTAVCDAIATVSESRLSQQIAMPWGERMTVALSLLSPSQHMRYHEGQINYIQTLYGDDEHH